MITFKAHSSERTTTTSNTVQSSKVLVCGAENSLAKYLAFGLLDSGAQVSVQAVNSDSCLSLKQSFSCVQYSLSDSRFAEALTHLAPDVVLHACADVIRERSSGWPISNYNRTVDKVAALCEAVQRHRPTARIVLLSTTDVYGECDTSKDEAGETVPVSMNGRFSLLAENVLTEFAQYHGLSATILRVASAYGPDVRHNPVADTLFNLLGPQGTNMKLAQEPDATRDLVHAGDVLQAVKLILANQTNGTYNIASGHSMSLNELNTHLCAILELNAQIAGGTPLFSEAKSQRFDVSKLGALGFAPQVPLIEGLRGYAAWWSGMKAA